jgi:uncharacterized coiled-coil DUF342 family protein
MNDQQRLIEVMAELLAEVHEVRLEMKGMREEQVKTNVAIGELRGEQAKTNLAIGELRLSVMKLADFGDRILQLEKEVFKKAS